MPTRGGQFQIFVWDMRAEFFSFRRIVETLFVKMTKRLRFSSLKTLNKVLKSWPLWYRFFPSGTYSPTPYRCETGPDGEDSYQFCFAQNVNYDAQKFSYSLRIRNCWPVAVVSGNNPGEYWFRNFGGNSWNFETVSSTNSLLSIHCESLHSPPTLQPGSCQ